MNDLMPGSDHPEAITLGLHDASPQNMVDEMADDPWRGEPGAQRRLVALAALGLGAEHGEDRR